MVFYVMESLFIRLPDYPLSMRQQVMSDVENPRDCVKCENLYGIHWF